jgi:prepilin-type N-terminal cleavage/methylation domain-containing protein
MRTQRARSSTSRDTDDGFTLIEVLVGMAILSLLGVAVWGGVTAALRAVSRSHDAALANARLLQLDDRFRAGAGRIRPPWWEPGLAIEESDGTWRIPFLDGAPERALTVTLKDGTLSIDDGEVATQYAGVSSATVGLQKDESGAAYGATLDVEGPGFGRLTFLALLGGVPVHERSGR